MISQERERILEQSNSGLASEWHREEIHAPSKPASVGQQHYGGQMIKLAQTQHSDFSKMFANFHHNIHLGKTKKDHINVITNGQIREWVLLFFWGTSVFEVSWRKKLHELGVVILRNMRWIYFYVYLFLEIRVAIFKAIWPWSI